MPNNQYYLPTFDEAVLMARECDAFTMSSVDVDGYTLYNFGYLMTASGYQVFEHPIPNNPVKGWEMRGLTFVRDPQGNMHRYLMLPKFNCLNQTQGSMLRDIKGKKIVSCSMKLDGSLIRFFPVGETIRPRSKNSFFGPHVEAAARLYEADKDLKGFVQEAIQSGLAPIFEFVSPEWKIIIPYEEERLRLIQLRDEATGIFHSLKDHPLVEKYGIETALVNYSTIEELMEGQKTEKGIEGWVVIFDDGQMMKVKTIEYDDFHDHFFERNHNVNKMVGMVLNETMDDAISMMDEDWPVRREAEVINDLVSGYVNKLVGQILSVVEDFSGDYTNREDMKAFTTQYRGNPYLPLYAQAVKNPHPMDVLVLVKSHVGKQTARVADAESFLARLKDEQLTLETEVSTLNYQ